MTKAVNIVSFNIPYPPNYGGVIDVFYKIKALSKEGYEVYLHTFIYDRTSSDELERICKKVYYYKRNTGLLYNFSLLPYIVYSRKQKELLINLSSNDFPIIFEGLHCCYYLGHKSLISRLLVYRESNIEHEYYKHLAIAEKNLLKALYYRLEAFRLKWYEKNLNKADLILAVSKEDANYFEGKYKTRVCYLPSFKGVESVASKIGKGNYILYHANLSVSENRKACLYLINNVFSKVKHKCIIAGLSPDTELVRAAEMHSNISIKADVSDDEMEHLIINAHIHVMITFQATGLKLKLMNALFKGRFCIVNKDMLYGTGLEDICKVANSSEDIIKAINITMSESFDHNMIEKRKDKLLGFTDNYLIKVLSKEIM